MSKGAKVRVRRMFKLSDDGARLERALDEVQPLPFSRKAPGYHLVDIPKGELGELSKIEEEVAELRDAEAQGCRIMELVELSDLIGAIDLYLEKRFPGIGLHDLMKMSSITARAFQNGHRG